MWAYASNLKLPSAILVLAISTSTAGQAQETRVATDSAGAASPAFLEEVIVTARKRAESAQNTPIAVNVFTAERLKELDIKGSEDLQSFVPSLQVSAGSLGGRARPSFALRGLRSNGVITYFSEVPANASVIGRSVYDLGSIQVLKGPQGTLFGQNTTAGALLFEPAKPTDQHEGSVELTAGNYSMLGAQAMINLPFSDKWSVRLAGDFEDRDGFAEIIGNNGSVRDQDSDRHQSERVSVLFTPTDRISNLTVFDRFYADEEPNLSKLVATAPCPPSPSIAQRLTLGACKYVPPLTTVLGLPDWGTRTAEEMATDPFETLNTFQGRSVTDSWGVSNVTTVNLTDGLVLKNIFGFRDDQFLTSQDTDGMIFPLQVVSSIDHNKRLTNELQLQGNINQLTWIIGAYYSDDEQRNQGEFGVADPGPISPVSLNSVNETKARALFAQATYGLTERLNLTGGYRYTWEDKDLTQVQRQGPTQACGFAPPNPFVDFATCTRNQDDTFTAPAWTLGADFKITDHILTYITSRRGFNSGGFNLVGKPRYETETITDLELGLKADWSVAGYPVRTNIAVYKSEYDDIQRSIRLFIDNVPRVIVANAASADVYGAELQLDANLGSYFSLSGGVTWLDPEYNDFQSEFSQGVFVDLSSNALAQAPEWSATASPTFRLPISQDIGADLSLTATWSYQSKVYFEDANPGNPFISNTLDPYTQQAGYSTFSAQLNWREVFGSRADLRIFGKNLGDKRYADFGANTLGTYGIASRIYGEPRTYGASVAYRFGD